METEEYTNKNNEWVKKSKRKSENTLRRMNIKTQIFKLWHSAKAVWSGFIDTSLLQETRIITNNLTCHLKELEKEEQIKPKDSRRKEIVKIRGNK